MSSSTVSTPPDHEREHDQKRGELPLVPAPVDRRLLQGRPWAEWKKTHASPTVRLDRHAARAVGIFRRLAEPGRVSPPAGHRGGRGPRAAGSPPAPRCRPRRRAGAGSCPVERALVGELRVERAGRSSSGNLSIVRKSCPRTEDGTHSIRANVRGQDRRHIFLPRARRRARRSRRRTAQGYPGEGGTVRKIPCNGARTPPPAQGTVTATARENGRFVKMPRRKSVSRLERIARTCAIWAKARVVKGRSATTGPPPGTGERHREHKIPSSAPTPSTNAHVPRVSTPSAGSTPSARAGSRR